jgi:hypothetical protein
MLWNFIFVTDMQSCFIQASPIFVGNARAYQRVAHYSAFLKGKLSTPFQNSLKFAGNAETLTVELHSSSLQPWLQISNLPKNPVTNTLAYFETSSVTTKRS